MKLKTFRERALFSLGLGSLFFVFDWSGYDRFNVDLFEPRALTDVWWHFPAAVGFVYFMTVAVTTSFPARD